MAKPLIITGAALTVLTICALAAYEASTWLGIARQMAGERWLEMTEEDWIGA